MSKRWSLKFCLSKKDVECYVWKSYDALEAKDIVKKLKLKIRRNGLSPVNTWILEYGFSTFDEIYKAQGYTLVSLSVTDARKNNGAIS